MEAKTRIGLTVFALIGMMLLGAAITQTFSNKADALGALGRQVTIVPEKCKVMEVRETIDLGSESSSKAIAVFELPYYINGEYRREIGNVVVVDLTQRGVETAVQMECDKLWLVVKSQESQTIDKAIVQYTQGALKSVLDRAYDVVKKTWADATGISPTG